MTVEQIHAWIETGGVLITALATIVLAFVTYILARETRRLASLGQQPQIVFTIEPSDFEISFLNAHVQNVGTAAAYDIRAEFSPAINFVDSKTVKRNPFDRISVLKPGQQVSSFMCSYGELLTKTFTVTTRWKRNPKTSTDESLSYTFDLSDFEGMVRLGKPGAPESLEKIAKALENLASGFKKLKVDVFDTEDRESERKTIDAAIAARRSKTGPQEDSAE